MIVSTPIDLPRLAPDDWHLWWDIWKTYAKPLTKVNQSPNSMTGEHIGFDVFKVQNLKSTYVAPFCPLNNLYPSLYSQLFKFSFAPAGIRFVMSNSNFYPHHDNGYENWSIRNMFYCEDPQPQWYYENANTGNRQWLKLPSSTNWWAYKDGVIKHGTIFRPEYPKIIVQVFCKLEYSEALATANFNKYPECQLEI